MTTRIEATRTIAATPAEVFDVLCDPQGHVAIDSSGMLQDATGDRVRAAGDTFVVHMDRESLGDLPEMGRYDVTVTIGDDFEDARSISWTVLGRVRPQIGHRYGYTLEPVDGASVVTGFYDWSDIHPDWAAMDIFPVISEHAISQTLGILDRTVRRGYARRTAP
jgi:hypothetical protein